MKIGIRNKHIIISSYTKNDNYYSGILKDIKSVRMDWKLDPYFLYNTTN